MQEVLERLRGPATRSAVFGGRIGGGGRAHDAFKEPCDLRSDPDTTVLVAEQLDRIGHGCSNLLARLRTTIRLAATAASRSRSRWSPSSPQNVHSATSVSIWNCCSLEGT